MKQLMLIALLLIAGTANAQGLTADAQYGVVYSPTELRLNYFPADQNKQYVTVFGTGARLTEAKGWFQTNADLKRLKDASHFSCIDTASTLFKERYASNTPATLLVRVQDSNGKVLNEFSNLPMSAEAFIRKMNHECLRREQDDPPQPLPPPNTPAPAPKPSLILWPAFVGAIVAAIAGALFGLRRKFIETY
jgi:hypothetical protein